MCYPQFEDNVAAMPRRRAKPAMLLSFGEQVIQSLRALEHSLAKGEEVTRRFTVRTVQLELEPREYSPNQVRAVRLRLGASQAVFAHLLAVTPKTLQGWEQGKPMPKIARRLLDLIDQNPKPWAELLRAAQL